MFNVVFIKQIFDAEEASPDVRFAVLQRKEQLPFAPVPGHAFFWNTDRAQKLVSVTWDFSGSNFSCNVEDEFPDNYSPDGFDFEELVENAQSNGWTLVRVYEAK